MENIENEKTVDLNSLSISELEQMVKDVKNYYNSIKLPDYYQLELSKLRREIIGSDISSPAQMKIGQNYGVFEDNDGYNLGLMIAKLIEIKYSTKYEKLKTKNTFFGYRIEEYQYEEAECYFLSEDNSIICGLDDSYSNLTTKIKMSNYRGFYCVSGQDKIFDLNNLKTDFYYKSIQEYKDSLVEPVRKRQIANWKIQEIQEIIQQKQASLIGDEDEYERLAQKYGKTK